VLTRNMHEFKSEVGCYTTPQPKRSEFSIFKAMLIMLEKGLGLTKMFDYKTNQGCS
jgi:hypothetical protein